MSVFLGNPRPALAGDGAPQRGLVHFQRGRVAWILAILAASSCLAAPTASAATVASVGGNGSTLAFSAAPGEVNDLTISESGGVVVVTDTSNLIAPGYGCQSGGWPGGSTTADHTIYCNVGHPYVVMTADLGDMADSLVSTAEVDIVVLGGEGNDAIQFDACGYGATIHGGAGDDTITVGNGAPPCAYRPHRSIFGEDGNDVINGTGAGSYAVQGGAGDDTIATGDGNDTIDEGLPATANGADTISGGAGTDTVTYENRAAGVRVSLDDVANDGAKREGDDIGSDVENLVGGAGNDVLTGSKRRNVITGGGGRDRLFGLAGADVFFADDLVADRIDGGAGRDTATMDFGKDRVRSVERRRHGARPPIIVMGRRAG